MRRDDDDDDDETNALVENFAQVNLSQRKPKVQTSMELAKLRLVIGKKSPCGIALLIGNWKYKNHKKYGDLPRCQKDIERMKGVFDKLGFITITKYKNLTKDELKRVFFDVSNDKRHGEIFAIYYSGHGTRLKDGSDQLSGVDGLGFKVDQVRNAFNPDNCPALATKPKLLLMDCCRGSDDEEVFMQEAKQVKTKGLNPTFGSAAPQIENSNWWIFSPVAPGKAADAEHTQSPLSPFTYWLADALEGMKGEEYSLHQAAQLVKGRAEEDMRSGYTSPMAINDHSFIKWDLYFA